MKAPATKPPMDRRPTTRPRRRPASAEIATTPSAIQSRRVTHRTVPGRPVDTPSRREETRRVAQSEGDGMAIERAPEIERLVEESRQAYRAGDAEALRRMTSTHPAALMVGTDPQEIRKGHDAIVS